MPSGGEGPDLNGIYKNFVCDKDGNYGGPATNTWDASTVVYVGTKDLGYLGEKSLDEAKKLFTVPMPTEDVVANPKMASDVPPIHVNVRETYSYDF